MTSSATTNADAVRRKSNIPTLLTVFRIAMGPVIAGLVLWATTLLYIDRSLAGLIFAAAFVLFVLAAATDWLDGWAARKLDAVTPLGAALDHAADKVLITCVLVALAFAALPLELVAASVLILGRDVAVAGLREGIAAQGKTLPVSELGKWKAAAEMCGVAAFLAFQTAALFGESAALVLGLHWGARLLFWTAAALALISGAQYLGALLRRT
ncbi:MAG: CDP-diacylglycerol--glycerol-3-phosphate 3-phosphatidyltransferase [Phycisphaerales bacterium]|nr:CDP-diacylglycerol--glycerol-3-phosphate 3-phosphatidyltransferase [Hyphomonadaceae bacterium]